MDAGPEGRSAVFLMGPTGTGKSDLAIRLTQVLPLEIISVDSAMVYCGMDIGTAKPEAAVRRVVPHHLIDIRDPASGYSAGEFVADAAAIMRDIWGRGKIPCLVGGTLLYFQALSDGIAALPEADFAVRAAIDAEAAAIGWPGVHRKLEEVDAVAAAKIHPNDPQRIQRALEVFRITGEPISRLQTDRRSVIAGADIAEFGLVPPDRAALHGRIEARFDGMLEAGLLDEVRRLQERTDLHAEHPSMRAVGYRQLWRYLAGHGTLSEAREGAIAATRQLAKRQMTWLRSRKSTSWLNCDGVDPLASVLSALSQRGFPRGHSFSRRPPPL